MVAYRAFCKLKAGKRGRTHWKKGNTPSQSVKLTPFDTIRNPLAVDSVATQGAFSCLLETFFFQFMERLGSTAELRLCSCTLRGTQARGGPRGGRE